MKSLILTAAALLTIMLGGCGMNFKEAAEKPEKPVQSEEPKENETPNIPDTKAFQDEFTREYLDPSAKTEKGFHLLKSETGGYEMLFPENGVISEMGYELNKDQFESFSINEESGVFPYQTDYNITYKSYDRGTGTEIKLDILSESVDYQGEYKNISDADKEMYFSNKILPIENDVYYMYFGLTKKMGKPNHLKIVYSIRCKKEDDSCAKKQSEYEEYFVKILSSVNFSGK